MNERVVWLKNTPLERGRVRIYACRDKTAIPI